jgi:hypothetical protein
MSQLGGSSGEDSPQKYRQPHGRRGTASFNNNLVNQTYTSSVISGTESGFDSATDDCAIDDEDEEWEEESADETANHSFEDKIQFKRVDANLPSRRSLITLMLKAQTASQSTPALPLTQAPLNGPSPDASPNDSDDASLITERNTNYAPPTHPINDVRRTAINVTANGIPFQAVLSPRATRGNMLATELTESLGRNLHRERSYGKPFMKKGGKKMDQNASSWDEFFNNPFGYQAQAW